MKRPNIFPSALTLILGLEAVTAFAIPSIDRHLSGRSTRPKNHIVLRPPAASLFTSDTTSDSPRGGALLTFNTNLSTATGTFAIPIPSVPITGPTANDTAIVFGFSIWAGLINDTDSTNTKTTTTTTPTAEADENEINNPAILRAGIDLFWDAGSVTANAWWSYSGALSSTSAPAASADFGNFTVAPGDVVRVTTAVPDAMGDHGDGFAMVENFGPGPGSGSGAVSSSRGPLGPAEQVAVQTFPFSGDGGGMVGSSSSSAAAAWVVEDFTVAGNPGIPVAMANFTDVSVSMAATGGWGGPAEVAGVRVFDVEELAQGGRLTRCVVGEDGGSDGKLVCERVVGE